MIGVWGPTGCIGSYYVIWYILAIHAQNSQYVRAGFLKIKLLSRIANEMNYATVNYSNLIA